MKLRVSRAEIAVGGFLIVAFLGFLVLVIGRGGFGSLGRTTFEVRATFSKVSGVRPGTLVKINGIEVGAVEAVRLNEQGRVEVIMVVDAQFRPHVRQSAAARARATERAEPGEADVAALIAEGNSLVKIEAPLLGGDSAVAILPASIAGAPVADGEYLLAEPAAHGISEAVKKLDAVLGDLVGGQDGKQSLGSLVEGIGQTLKELKVVVDKLGETMKGAPESSVGRLLNDEGRTYDGLNASISKLNDTMDALRASVEGTQARLGGSLDRVDATLGRFDKTVAHLDEKLGASADRLESTLAEVERLVAGANERGLLAAIDGPAGELRRRLEGLLASLDGVLADLKATSAKLPKLADAGQGLVDRGKGSIGEIDDVVAASRRHWLLKGLFRPPTDAWLRAWDLGPEGK